MFLTNLPNNNFEYKRVSPRKMYENMQPMRNIQQDEVSFTALKNNTVKPSLVEQAKAKIKEFNLLKMVNETQARAEEYKIDAQNVLDGSKVCFEDTKEDIKEAYELLDKAKEYYSKGKSNGFKDYRPDRHTLIKFDTSNEKATVVEEYDMGGLRKIIEVNNNQPEKSYKISVVDKKDDSCSDSYCFCGESAYIVKNMKMLSEDRYAFDKAIFAYDSDNVSVYSNGELSVKHGSKIAEEKYAFAEDGKLYFYTKDLKHHVPMHPEWRSYDAYSKHYVYNNGTLEKCEINKVGNLDSEKTDEICEYENGQLKSSIQNLHEQYCRGEIYPYAKRIASVMTFVDGQISTIEEDRENFPWKKDSGVIYEFKNNKLVSACK